MLRWDLGRVDQGIAVIESALVRDPNNAEILASLSEAWWHRGDRAKAESFAERALAANPDLGNALLVLGAARTARGDLEGAVAALARAVRVDSDDVTSRLKLASAYAQLGRTAETCAAWRDVLHLPAALPQDWARASREASERGCPGCRDCRLSARTRRRIHKPRENRWSLKRSFVVCAVAMTTLPASPSLGPPPRTPGGGSDVVVAAARPAMAPSCGLACTAAALGERSFHRRRVFERHDPRKRNHQHKRPRS